MANGYDCDKHSKVEERLYKLESEDKVMNEKLNFILESIKKIEKKMQTLETKLNNMTIKVAVGSVIIYTILNIMLKKVGV